MAKTDYLDFALSVWKGQAAGEDMRPMLRGFVGSPFSRKAIERMSGVSAARVRREVPKTDKTGGAFEPETLPLLVEMRDDYTLAHCIKGDTVRAVIRGGTGYRMCARLTGISESTLRRAEETVADNLLSL